VLSRVLHLPRLDRSSESIRLGSWVPSNGTPLLSRGGVAEGGVVLVKEIRFLLNNRPVCAS
jgi:hypothetical protein